MSRPETQPKQPLHAMRELGLSAMALYHTARTPELTQRERFFALLVELGCPELNRNPQLVSAVVKYGMFIDDFFDTKIDRRKTMEVLQSQSTSDPNSGLQMTEDERDIEKKLNIKIGAAVERQGNGTKKQRDLGNIAAWQKACWDVELGALYLPYNKWTPELVKKYRDVVAFGWSGLFASLGPNSQLVLPEPNQSDYSQQPELAIEVLHKQYLDSFKNAGDEGKRALNLAYQMMIVQVYGDVRGREWNMKQGIPCISGIGYPPDVDPEEVFQQEKLYYSNQAKAVGLNGINDVLLNKVFDRFYRMYKSKAPSWDAAKKS